MALTKTSYSMIAGAPANVIDFGADPTGVLDSTAAIQKATDDFNSVVIPEGTYRIDGTIYLKEFKSIQLMGGAFLYRYSAYSANTAPIVWVYGRYGALTGAGQAVCGLRTQNKAPNGVLLIGQQSMSIVHDDVNWNSISSFGVVGMQEQGQTSGAPDVCILIQAPELDGKTVYFQNIRDMFVANANYGIWLRGFADGNTIQQIQGLELGDDTVNGGAFFYDNGSLDNAISDCFLHRSTNCVAIKFEEIDNTGSGGFLYQTYTTSYKGIVCEQGGANALGVKATDGSVNGCYIEIRPNVVLGNDLDAGFRDRNTFIGLESLTKVVYDEGAIRPARYNATQTDSTSIIGFSKYTSFSNLTENTKYKLVGIETTGQNQSALVEIKFYSSSGNALDSAGGGYMVGIVKRDNSNVVTFTPKIYTQNMGGSLVYKIDGNTVEIIVLVANAGTGTSAYDFAADISITGRPVNFVTVYDNNNKVTTTGGTTFTNPTYA